MDPQTDLPDLVEDLEVNIDELSDVLSPLLSTPLSTTASSLPLLDKAKLYVLAAYSIESLLYSTLQASGVNAKEHAIFKELGRLKGYFGKIKDVEGRAMAPSAPKSKLDVGAAARFIKHGLAGNDKYDLERAERMAKERARAHLKAQQVNKKFDDNGAETPKAATPKKRDVEEMEAEELVKEGDDEDEVIGGLEEPAVEQPAPKRQRMSVAAEPMDVDSAPSPAPSQSQSDDKKKKKQHRAGKKKAAKFAQASEAETEPEAPQDTVQVLPEESQPTIEAKPANKKKSKKTSKSTESSEAEEAPQSASSPASPASPPKQKKRNTRSTKPKSTDETEDPTDVPSRAPKTRSETFNALLDGSLPDEKKTKGRGRPPKAKAKK